VATLRIPAALAYSRVFPRTSQGPTALTVSPSQRAAIEIATIAGVCALQFSTQRRQVKLESGLQSAVQNVIIHPA
jgi:hypothetical protein